MTTTCYSLDAVSGAPSYSGKQARVSLGALAGGKNTARPLGAFSGVVVGTPDDTCSISGTTWTVKPHTGLIDLHTAADAGPYMYAVTANETGSINAAHGTHPRIDILWVRIDDPAQSDGSSVPAAVIGYTAGTAAASPTQPSTPTRSMLLAVINVPQSGGGSASLTFKAPRTAAAGGIFPVRNTTERATLATHAGASANRPLFIHRADGRAGKRFEMLESGTEYRAISTEYPPVADTTARNALSGMVADDRVLQLDSMVIYRYNGSAWKAWESDWISYTPTLSSIAIGTGGSATNSAEYQYAHGRIAVRGRIILGTSGASVSSYPSITLPSTARALNCAYQTYPGDGTFYDTSVALNRRVGVAASNTSVTAVLLMPFTGTTDSRGSCDASNPFIWAAGDVITYDFAYDPA